MIFFPLKYYGQLINRGASNFKIYECKSDFSTMEQLLFGSIFIRLIFEKTITMIITFYIFAIINLDSLVVTTSKMTAVFHYIIYIVHTFSLRIYIIFGIFKVIFESIDIRSFVERGENELIYGIDEAGIDILITNRRPPTTKKMVCEYDRCFIVPFIDNKRLECSVNLKDNSMKTSNGEPIVDFDIMKCSRNGIGKCAKIFKESGDFVKIVNFNAQGLLEGGHLESIIAINVNLNADVIAISESWLNPSIRNGTISMDSYRLYRSDRNFKRQHIKKGGGGVCVYIKSEFEVKSIEKSNGGRISSFDYMILEVKNRSIKFLFCNLYRRGDCMDTETNEILNRIIELSMEYEHVVICGDFNANRFDVTKFSKLGALSACMALVNDNCPTYIAGSFNPSQLDLIFTKNLIDVKHFGHFPAAGVSNHQAIYCVLNFYTTKKKMKTYYFRNFSNIDEMQIAHFAEQIDWDIFSYGRGVDDMVNDLYVILNKFLDEICPLKQITTRNRPVPWMSNELRNKMGERKMFYDWWHMNRKHASANIIYDTYKRLNNGIKYEIRHKKRDTFTDQYYAAQSSGERWNLIHKYGVTRKAQKNDARNAYFDKRFTVDDLNEYFARLTPLPIVDLKLEPASTKFEFELVEPEGILEIMGGIKSNSTGPDKIPPKCFKLLANYMARPISVILNTSIVTGRFPGALQQISITPIPKVERPESVSQFRPISNANFLLKIISSACCNQLTEYLEKNGLITEHQSGFRNAHSCTTAILNLSENIHKSIAGGKCVILVLLDFSNAFGSVDHDILLQTLRGVGVGERSMKWYESFLNGWRQVVQHDGSVSNPKTIRRGIIQGENSSTILFTIFINNLVKYIRECKAILFADDVQIYIESDIEDVNENIERINNDLRNIERFTGDYGIDINPEKTKAIIISSANNKNKLKYDELPGIRINGSEIEYVDSVRNLGYQMNRTMTGADHVGAIQKKVYGALNSVYPLKEILPSEIKLQLYKTLILPIFDYMDIIYHDFGVHGTNGMSDKLERLQNIAIRFISKVKRREHITPYRNDLNLMRLFDRRTLHVVGQINRILIGEAPPYLGDIIALNTNYTRGSDKLIIKKPRNNFHKTSFGIGAPIEWNKLPNEIRSIKDNDEFKSEIISYFIDNQNDN